MKGLIERQAAIDAVLGACKDTATTECAVRELEELPPAQPEQRWIPVTERLPEDDEEVIVSCTDDSGDSKFTYTTVGWHYKGVWVVNNDRCFFVVAWMPLPEPYRAERRTDEQTKD